MWICPVCGRVFRNTDQAHTCELIIEEDLFRNRPPFLRELFVDLEAKVRLFGEYRKECVKPDVIFFKTKSTFMAVKVKKYHLEVEFFLDFLVDEPPVSKNLQTSKNRFAHIVPIDSPEDLQSQLLHWLQFSYNLISNA